MKTPNKKWNITVTRFFLESLLDLPPKVHKNLKKVFKRLEEDPSNCANVKKINRQNFFRFRVTRRWRLLYSYNNTCVKILDIRDRDTAYDRLDPLEKDSTPPFLEYDDISLSVKITTDESADHLSSKIQDRKLLTEKQLERWKIDKRYWGKLLDLMDENDILSERLGIPDNHLEVIINKLYEPTEEDVQEIQNDDIPTYVINPDTDDIQNYVEGKCGIASFLLQLSKEQEKILQEESNYPTLVKGGPGTGKSTIAIYKVRNLIKSGAKKILFTTYNTLLLDSSRTQLEALLGQENLSDKGLDIKAVDELVIDFHTRNYAEPIFCERPVQMILLQSAIDMVGIKQVRQRLKNLSDEYLLEEFSIVIENREGIETCDEYLEINRFGRGLKLGAKQRKLVWEIYEQWVGLIEKSGLITYGQLYLKSLELAKKLDSKPYNFVVIDEAQDLSPVALAFLVHLCKPEGIYLTADTEQSLAQRSFSWDHIQKHIGFKGEVKNLRKSFRNTEQIGKAYTNILMSSEVYLYSKLQGEKPKLLLTDNLDQQAICIKEFFETVSKKYKFPKATGVILTPDADYGKLVAQQLSFKNMPTKYIEFEKLKIADGYIKVIDLHSAKGLEFPFVVLIGLQKDMLPTFSNNIPDQERGELLKQQRQLFYVGCSRAMRALLVCASKSRPSEFINELNSDYYWQKEEK